ncbi:hypothetical protein NBRC10513v2_004180 [Rhodotorula toruloides]
MIGCALDITDIGDGENGPTSVEESWVPSHWLPCAAMEIASPELPERILDANGMPLVLRQLIDQMANLPSGIFNMRTFANLHILTLSHVKWASDWHLRDVPTSKYY